MKLSDSQKAESVAEAETDEQSRAESVAEIEAVLDGQGMSTTTHIRTAKMLHIDSAILLSVPFLILYLLF